MISTIILLGVSSLLLWAYQKLRSWRGLLSDLPSLRREFFWGNLKVMGDYRRPRQHPEYAFERMYEELNEPEIFVLDFAPMISMCVVTDPKVAEQISAPSARFPYAMPKSYSLADVVPIVGPTSILLAEGEEWRHLRKQFAPGFQPKHLQSLIPSIIDEVGILKSNLLAKCASGEEFELSMLLTNFTIDVIGVVALSQSFGAQLTPNGVGIRGPNGVLTAFLGVQENIVERSEILDRMFGFEKKRKLKKYNKILNDQVEIMIKKAADDPTLAERSVIALGLKGKELTPDVLAVAVDQMRTFIFAGYDTTASILQWVYYFLSLPENGAYLADVCAEHDAILGPKDDLEGVKKALMEDPPMPYTTAVFKEALRLNPPASSARWVPPWDDDFFLTQNDGSRYKVNGSVIVISHRIIQNSRKVWGPDAKVFRPTRWLDKEYMANIPTGAFRPFERGPRACIGQELSHIESKIALGLTLRHFRFKHVVGEISELGEMWNGYKITGQPYDGMKVTVKEA